MSPWVIFAGSSVLVILAGTRLARDGDTIAVRTGLGGAWVGAILVAAATSLPEITTGLYAVGQGTPSLAVGDLFGAGMANMLILGLADLATRHVRVLTRVAINQALVAALAISLTATAAAGVLVAGDFTLLGAGWAPLMIGVGYLGGMRLLHINRAGPPFESVREARAAERETPRLRGAVLGFLAAAAVILLAARFLAASAADIAELLGVSTGFVGVALLAITTTLPELVVSITSMRAGSYDLAVGNLLGSNCLNMVVLLLLDVADGPGPLLANIETSALVGALFAIVLMGQVLLEILNNAEHRVWYLEPGALFLVATYAFGLYLTFLVGH
jgi:cation:H+ antiporter